MGLDCRSQTCWRRSLVDFAVFRRGKIKQEVQFFSGKGFWADDFFTTISAFLKGKGPVPASQSWWCTLSIYIVRLPLHGAPQFFFFAKSFFWRKHAFWKKRIFLSAQSSGVHARCMKVPPRLLPLHPKDAWGLNLSTFSRFFCDFSWFFVIFWSFYEMATANWIVE